MNFLLIKARNCGFGSSSRFGRFIIRKHNIISLLSVFLDVVIPLIIDLLLVGLIVLFGLGLLETKNSLFEPEIPESSITAVRI